MEFANFLHAMTNFVLVVVAAAILPGFSALNTAGLAMGALVLAQMLYLVSILLIERREAACDRAITARTVPARHDQKSDG